MLRAKKMEPNFLKFQTFFFCPFPFADDEVFIDIIGKSPSVQIQAIKVSERARRPASTYVCIFI